MSDYRIEQADPDQIAREAVYFGDLAAATRELIDAGIRTTADAAVVTEVTETIRAATARLAASQIDGSYGVSIDESGGVRAYGNAVVGLRNAVAPPVEVETSEDGRAWGDFHLGAAYEGPPGLVHGGVTALILDQICGQAAAARGKPGMTGTLTLRYRHGTPLGALHAEAHVVRVDGVKTFVVGHMATADGTPTVECEGIFILPRWARQDPDATDSGEAERTPERFE